MGLDMNMPDSSLRQYFTCERLALLQIVPGFFRKKYKGRLCILAVIFFQTQREKN